VVIIHGVEGAAERARGERRFRGPGGRIKRSGQSRLKRKYIGERAASTCLVIRRLLLRPYCWYDAGDARRAGEISSVARRRSILATLLTVGDWRLTRSKQSSIRKWTSSLTLEFRGSEFYQPEWDSTTERTRPEGSSLIFIALATGESLSEARSRAASAEEAFCVSVLAAVAVAVAVVAVRGSCTLLARCASSSSSLVARGARSYVAEGNRSAAESPEAARHGTAAEDITITYLAALPLHSRLGARRTRTCARARVCVRVSVLLRECVRRRRHRVPSRVFRRLCSGACGRRRGRKSERERKPGLRQTEEIWALLPYCRPPSTLNEGKEVSVPRASYSLSLARAFSLSLSFVSHLI